MTPRRGPPLSQHFLHDDRIAARIADALSAGPGERILEIGPGEGSLTRHLIDTGREVHVVELDRDLAAALRERWGHRSDLRVIGGDALEVVLPEDAGPPWHVIGNLPYAITSPLLFHWLDQADRVPIVELVFMMQREVAERLVAEPGTRAFGALSVGIRLAASVERLFDVGSGAFRPAPSVVSTVVRLVPEDRSGVDPVRRERIRRLTRDLFGQRRKQIQKGLRTLGRIDAEQVTSIEARAGFDFSRRPATLDVAEWVRLDAALQGCAGGDELCPA